MGVLGGGVGVLGGGVGVLGGGVDLEPGGTHLRGGCWDPSRDGTGLFERMLHQAVERLKLSCGVQ